VLHVLLAPRIVKYVNMYSLATGIESQSTKGAQVFTQPARGSIAPFTDASLVPAVNAVFMAPFVAELLQRGYDSAAEEYGQGN